MYEAQVLINSIHLKEKESWEQARFISYITAQVNSSKKLKPTDILKFSWDDKTVEKETTITDTDINRLQARAQEFEKILQEKNGK